MMQQIVFAGGFYVGDPKDPMCVVASEPCVWGEFFGSAQNGKILSMVELAQHQYASGNYEQARSTCLAILNVEPQSVDAHLLLGAIYCKLKDFVLAVTHNDTALRLNPNFAEGWSNLGNAFKELGNLDGALGCYLRAISLKPKFADAYNNLAGLYMQQGRLDLALDFYKSALSIDPNAANTWANLGELYKCCNNPAEAQKCFAKALALQPDNSRCWCALGLLMKERGHMAQAVPLFLEAIRHTPTCAEAFASLGNVYQEMNQRQEALRMYEQAIALRPNYVMVYANMATIYYETRELDRCIELYEHATQLEPTFANAFNNLGNALKDVGRIHDAINAYRACLQISADHPHAFNNLGNALKDLGRTEDALSCYQSAIRCSTHFAAAHSNLASLLKEKGKLDMAITHYREAIRIDPNFADAYSNLGNAYKDAGSMQDAIASYQMAIQLKPNFADAHSNLASTYKDSGHINEAIFHYRLALALKPDFPDALCNLVHSLQFVSNWEDRDRYMDQLRQCLKQQLAQGLCPSVQPFHALCYPLEAEEMISISVKYAEKASLQAEVYQSLDPSLSFRFPPRVPSLRRSQLGRKLRIGYVSSDFGNHPLSHLMQSTFGMHDRKFYDVFLFALTPSDNSQWRQRLEAENENFIVLSQVSDPDAAKIIHSHNIDILINLNGYTKGARNEIFALCPAPIQMLYMGFPGTMGAPFIDYLITDAVTSPPHLSHYYTENLLRMPHCYFVNDHMQSFPGILQPLSAKGRQQLRAQYGLPQDAVVFCNFCQLYKVDPPTFDVWCNILRRTPNSLLWLLRFPALAEPNIRRAAVSRGIDPSRIMFTDVAAKEEYIARGKAADLCLDTPTCNGHTTGCDVLWAGVPVLTCPLNHMASRVAASLLSALDVPELIANSLADFEEQAVRLGNNSKELQSLRSKVETKRTQSPLFNTRQWVRDLERCYEAAWERHSLKLLPATIDVLADDESGEVPT